MKRIVLYGAGLEGEKFYVRWKNEYDIQYVIDKRANRFFHGLKVFSLEEKQDELKDYLIVVAMDKNHFEEVSVNLENLGYVEFDNFIWMDSIGKKCMILFGNCHMAIIEMYLKANPVIAENYTVWRYFVSDTKEIYRVPNDRRLAECSVFIAQDIQNENSAGVPGVDSLKEKLSPHCISLVIPNVYGSNLFFPQLNTAREAEKISNEINKRHKAEVYAQADMPSNTEWALRYLQGTHDMNIDRMYEEGKKVKDIVDYMMAPDTYPEAMIVENFRKELGKIKAREADCDITISDYIEENYKDSQLFYEPYHPTNNLLCEYGKRILEYLGIEAYKIMPFTYCLDSNEAFIYESVKKALGIRFEQKYIKKYSISCTLQNRAMNLREFVVNYIAWIYGEVMDQ